MIQDLINTRRVVSFGNPIAGPNCIRIFVIKRFTVVFIIIGDLSSFPSGETKFAVGRSRVTTGLNVPASVAFGSGTPSRLSIVIRV